MANVLGFVWFVIGFLVFHTGLLVWTALMLPNPVRRARGQITGHPYGSFFAGLGVLLVTAIAALALIGGGRPGVVQLLGWVVMGPALAMAAIGGAGFATLAAERIAARTQSGAEVPALVGGALVTALAGWLPVLGWFFFAPIVLMMSIGSGLIGTLTRDLQPIRAEVSAPISIPQEFLVEPDGAPAHPMAGTRA